MILRNVLSQFFIVKCFSKSLLVRNNNNNNNNETNRGMAADCNCFLKRLAAWIRKLLSFEILRSLYIHTCVRSFRAYFHKIPQGDFIEWWLPLKRYPSVCDNGASSVIYCLVEMNRFLVEFFFPIYIFLMEWIFFNRN